MSETGNKEVFERLTKKVIEVSPDPAALCLEKLVSSEGKDVYKDIPSLAEKLIKAGVETSAVKQVELVLYGSPFLRYLDQLDRGLSAIDVNNIILMAENSGLSANAARRTVSSLLYGLHVPQLGQDLSADEMEKKVSRFSIYIPPAAYDDRLREIKRKIEENKKLEAEDFSELNAYARAGIPEANAILGWMNITGSGVPENSGEGLQYLERAAKHGNAEAYGFLGDYYYGLDNQAAFDFYRRPGALAVGEERKSRFKNLEKVLDFSKKQVVCMVVFALLSSLFMLLFHVSSVTGEHIVAAVVLTVVNCMIAIVMLVVHMKNAFYDMRYLALLYLIPFSIFIMILT